MLNISISGLRLQLKLAVIALTMTVFAFGTIIISKIGEATKLTQSSLISRVVIITLFVTHFHLQF